MYLVLFIVAAASLLADAKHLPTYIKACKKADPNFRKCVIDSATATLPHIMQGDKDFKSPVLSPFKISEITVSPSNQLTVKLKDVTLYGLENAVVEDIDFDLKKRHVAVKLGFKWIRIEGQYEIDGRILVVPIKGQGPANITSYDLVVDFQFDYNLIKKADGKEYFDSNIEPVVSYTIKNNSFYFGNLFNGDKLLEERTNQFLNENWMAVYEDLKGAISETIKTVCTTLIETFIGTVPFNEVFP